MGNYIIAILATYGVASLLSSYDAPLGIFQRLRKKGLPECMVCLSVWIGAPIAYFADIGVLGYFTILGAIIIMDRI